MRKTDVVIQRDVIDELRWDPKVGVSEIAVAVQEGVVTLAGHVESYARRFAAMQAAERVAGVRAVADQLIVKLPKSLLRTDTELAHSVVHILKWDVLVPHEQIKSRIEDGWVWLDGEVEWPFQSFSAERSVRNLAGVRGVTNLIRVRARVTAPDVKERIESALERNAEIDAKDIRVETSGGLVTLKGTVRSFAERKDAERAAWSAPGVTMVEDELLVSA